MLLKIRKTNSKLLKPIQKLLNIIKINLIIQNINKNYQKQLQATTSFLIAFKQFLKRSLPNIKPSSEFIQSIKDRIKIIDAPENSL